MSSLKFKEKCWRQRAYSTEQLNDYCPRKSWEKKPPIKAHMIVNRYKVHEYLTFVDHRLEALRNCVIPATSVYKGSAKSQDGICNLKLKIKIV